MDKVYYFSAIILGSISIYVRFGVENIGLMFLGILLFPIAAFISRWISSFIYFLLFRIVGKIEVTFEIVKTVLYPLIALESLVRLVSGVLFAKTNLLTNVFVLILYIWFKVLVLIILAYKMKQTFKKSILLTFVLIIFEVLLTILARGML